MSQFANAPGLRVAVLAGGDSPEREVSLASGEQVLLALRRAGHRAECIDPAEVAPEDVPWRQFDACFLALHGGAGEDGRVQQRLSKLGVAYTGSDAAASRLAMFKSASKQRFAQAGVPAKPYALVQAGDSAAEVRGKTRRLGRPLVVKPDNQGSSLGLSFAATDDELLAAVAEALRFGDTALVEPWIDGREFTVALLGRRPLAPLEIATPRGLFDYEAKYESAMTEYRFETGLAAAKLARLQHLAIAAAEAIGTRGLVRVDLMLDRRGRAWALEVNTIPGLTAHSLAPKAAAQAGLDMTALCQWMLNDCLSIEAMP